MHRITLLLAFLAGPLAWAVGAQGADLEIRGPDAVPEHRLVRLEAVGEADDTAWIVVPFDRADGTKVDATHYEFTGPPGTYQVILIGLRERALAQAARVVTIGPVPVPPGPNPGPGPGPNPVPPGPGPAAGHLSVYYLCPAAPTGAQAALRADPALRASLAALDARWYSFTAGQPAARALGLADYPAPAVLVATEAGKVLKVLTGGDVTVGDILRTVGLIREGK